MKSGEEGRMIYKRMVAPLVGAWIEIYKCSPFIYLTWVAPLVGAWIEISHISGSSNSDLSLLL